MKLFSLSRLIVSGAKPWTVGACLCTCSIESSVAIVVQHDDFVPNGEKS